MKFDFEARQHAGNVPGAAMQCHNVYRFGNILVCVTSSGRSHKGTITFNFKDQQGQQCTASEWLSQDLDPWLAVTVKSDQRGQALSFHGAPDVHISTYQGPGIDVEVLTYGRTHYSSFTVAPVQHPGQLTATSLTSCGECCTVDVLQAEAPMAVAAQLGFQATACSTAEVQQCVAGM